jgi:D-lyxose ketol-isomerase
MLDEQAQKEVRSKALDIFKKANIVLTEEEIRKGIKIYDYNTGDFYEIGLVIVTFVDEERYCGRLIVFFPGQSVGEHWHPDVNENKGKEETFRVLYGKAYAYGEGEPTKNIKAKIPVGREKYYTSRCETILNPGDQYTVRLNEKHWWQGGPEGVLALEVSSKTRDEYDQYTDKSLRCEIY